MVITILKETCDYEHDDCGDPRCHCHHGHCYYDHGGGQCCSPDGPGQPEATGIPSDNAGTPSDNAGTPSDNAGIPSDHPATPSDNAGTPSGRFTCGPATSTAGLCYLASHRTDSAAVPAGVGACANFAAADLTSGDYDTVSTPGSSAA